MKTLSYLKHAALKVLADAVLVNLGLFLGLFARYAVLVGLNEAPNILLDFTTPADLWRDSMLAFKSAAPVLTLICLAVFGLSGFYRPEQPYRERRNISVAQATSVAFLIFALVSYLILLLGYLARQWGFAPFSRSALFAGWGFTLGLLLVARKGASVWAAAREGRLPGQLIRNRYFVASDLMFVALAVWLSFFARLESAGMAQYRVSLWVYLGIALVVKPLIFQIFGLYRRYWRYASVGELVTIVEANAVATLCVILLAYLVMPIFIGFEQVPRSIPFIDFFLTTASVGGARFLVRLLGDRQLLRRLDKNAAEAVAPRRVLIVGAGDAGAMIVREIQSSTRIDMEAVGFVDDDSSKRNVRILDVPVLGILQDLPALVGEFQISEVIVAMPTAPGAIIREVKRLCQQANVPCRVLPGIYELLNGRVSVNQLRPVRIDDLLRRDPVEIDKAALGQYLGGVRILVTGAGGSIGSELCRQIANFNPLQLVLLGHGENSIYSIERELRATYPDLDLVACIANVRDPQRLDLVFSRYRPNVVFHAAAHKHVPLMECNVEEVVTNNVLGTQCVLSASVKYGVDRFVLISTDKAVNPRSVMGASKRVAEMMVQDAARRAAGVFVAVRFGNVLGSRGSVVPLFQEQIAAGGPITITDPGMERFFMTIPEAVNLVLQAGALGRSGAIYMLDMGRPVRIVDLARDMIELSGLCPDDIEIRFIGVRPGEKIREELSTQDEDTSPTSHPRIKMLRSVLTLASRRLDEAVQEIVSVARNGGEHETRVRLMELATVNSKCEDGQAGPHDQGASLANATSAAKNQDSQVTP